MFTGEYNIKYNFNATDNKFKKKSKKTTVAETFKENIFLNKYVHILLEKIN
jgi:hypothetical protein